jgi:hypothetical protein
MDNQTQSGECPARNIHLIPQSHDLDIHKTAYDILMNMIRSGFLSGFYYWDDKQTSETVARQAYLIADALKQEQEKRK